MTGINGATVRVDGAKVKICRLVEVTVLIASGSINFTIFRSTVLAFLGVAVP